MGCSSFLLVSLSVLSCLAILVIRDFLGL
jgi:hypothetical protein